MVGGTGLGTSTRCGKIVARVVLGLTRQNTAKQDREKLHFQFEVFSPEVQVWHMSKETLEDFGRVFFVPFLVEAVRLASTRPDTNSFCVQGSALGQVVLQGRAWFAPINWARVLDSFVYVCNQHVSRAARCDGQPRCRKVAIGKLLLPIHTSLTDRSVHHNSQLMLHTLSFVETAFWLMGRPLSVFVFHSHVV
jgi:hypothetical protein